MDIGEVCGLITSEILSYTKQLGSLSGGKYIYLFSQLLIIVATITITHAYHRNIPLRRKLDCAVLYNVEALSLIISVVHLSFYKMAGAFILFMMLNPLFVIFFPFLFIEKQWIRTGLLLVLTLFYYAIMMSGFANK